MLFVKIGGIEPVVGYLSLEIGQRLSNKAKVLWLVAGGSAMDIAVEVAKRLSSPELAKLTVSLTDERYGELGHADSNWQQLTKKGFAIKGARLVPVLGGGTIEDSAKEYADFLEKSVHEADYSLALAGMGEDGHIFGIKPTSPAVNSKELICAYKWDDYERLTPTMKFLKRLDETVLYATGEAKWPQLDKLGQDLSPNDQPAQLLKQLANVTIFNDYMGSSG